MSLKNNIIALFVVLFLVFSNAKAIAAGANFDYSANTKDALIGRAISLMEKSNMSSSVRVLQGENSTKKPVNVEFANLSAISVEYMNADAVTVISQDGSMSIYIDKALKNSPPEAIACLLGHETMHNDAVSSIEEEVCAWTTEATIWLSFVSKTPALAKMDESQYPLIERLNYLSEMYQSSGNTSAAIRQEVLASEIYTKLALHSTGY